MSKRRGFTLIELLIVVAIIAILAAIAVPNFLEAQVRAKVSRVKSDVRTIATAMEAYLVDYNIYPPDSDNTLLDPGQVQKGFLYLTSPIAYITSLPQDPFQSHLQTSDPNSAKFYEMGSASDNEGWTWRTDLGGTTQNPTSPLWFRTNAYIIISVGPDKNDDVSGNDNWPGPRVVNNSAAVRMTTYDPTNGTVSDGDIVRAGGTLGAGYYFVNNQLFGKIGD